MPDKAHAHITAIRENPDGHVDDTPLGAMLAHLRTDHGQEIGFAMMAAPEADALHTRLHGWARGLFAD